MNRDFRSPIAGRPPRAFALAAALVLAVLPSCTDSSGPGTEDQGSLWDHSQDQVFFVSNRDAVASGTVGTDIYRVNADGTGLQRLTTVSAAYKDLHLSPDGTKIAYYSDQAGCYNIWVMDIDGTHATQLTSLDGLERCNEMPRWSPDGTKIAFHSSRNLSLGWDVYVMNADGTGVVNVSANPSTDDATNGDLYAGWTPDGRVVMQSNRTGTYRTYVVNADGTGVQPLFSDAFLNPFWSPTGAKVVATLGAEVYALNADGTGAVNVSNDPGVDGYVADPWSPDGSKIAFRSTRTGNGEIFVANADGTGVTNLTNTPGVSEEMYGWSKDGTKILFVGTKTGDNEIYVMNADGTGVVNLSNDPGDDQRAIWVPKK